MTWRTKRQIKYLAAFFIFLSLIFYLMYFLVKSKDVDICSNGVKDKVEIGIDCGGICPPCELKNFKPLKIYPTKFLQYGNKIDILGFIENPNENLALKNLRYYFEIYDEVGNLKEKTKERSTIIEPNEKRYLTELNYPISDFKIEKIILKIIEPSKKDWLSLSYQEIQVSYYNFKVKKEMAKTKINLTLFNQSYYDYNNLEIILLLYKGNDLVLINKTIVSLKAEENKEISFFIPEEVSNFTDFYVHIQRSFLSE